MWRRIETRPVCPNVSLPTGLVFHGPEAQEASPDPVNPGTALS